MGCRIVLFPLPFVGHSTPMLHLGNALHSKGFSITVIHTHFNSPNPSKFPNLTFHFIEDAHSSSDAFKIAHELNANCLAPFRDCLSRIIKDASQRVACLIFDPLWHFTSIVAQEFNLPRITLRTGGILAFIQYDALPLLQQNGYFPLQDARKEEAVPELPPLKVKDLTSEVHHDTFVAMVNEIKHCTHGMICNTFKELEGSFIDKIQQIVPYIPIFPIGPLNKYVRSQVSHDESYLTWLNTQTPNSVLYVSFGTLASISKEQLLEVAWGLARSEQPFLWVARSNLTEGSENNNNSLPEDFLRTVTEMGRVIPWAPQLDILAHPSVGGFWTHCGWNSTLESISEGVPMICFPFFGDQKANARQVSETWRIGLELNKGLERVEIARTIRRLMVEEEGKEMRERAEALKEKADQCIRNGGSSSDLLDNLVSHILSFCDAEK